MFNRAKSVIVQLLAEAGHDVSGYSDLKVLKSNAGYYVGTQFTGGGIPYPQPGSRDTGYFATEEEADDLLDKINGLALMGIDYSQYLRSHP